jgi:hypothetical protein
MNGPMAEWLGTGLQNPSRRFNSASDLTEFRSPGNRSYICRGGGTGRHRRLKISQPKSYAGSTPACGTLNKSLSSMKKGSREFSAAFSRFVYDYGYTVRYRITRFMSLRDATPTMRGAIFRPFSFSSAVTSSSSRLALSINRSVFGASFSLNLINARFTQIKSLGERQFLTSRLLTLCFCRVIRPS